MVFLETLVTTVPGSALQAAFNIDISVLDTDRGI